MVSYVFEVKGYVKVRIGYRLVSSFVLIGLQRR